MPKYTEHFQLKPDELDLIEHALRRELSNLNKDVNFDQVAHHDGSGRARDVNNLLGKLFNQKKFYAHVNDTGVPAG